MNAPYGSVNLTKYFDLALLINLPQRKDRLRSAKAEFARVGWSLAYGEVELFAACSFNHAAGFPSPGVRGCFQSHYECLRRAQSEQRRNVLIFEDDVALSSALPRLTPSLLSLLTREQWDFVYFGHENTGSIAVADADTDHVELTLYNDELLTAHFYAVNGRILPRLLEHLRTVASGVQSDLGLVQMPVDGAFNVFRAQNPDVRTLIAAPKLGWQRPSRSDLTPKAFDAMLPLRPFASLLREVKHALLRRQR